VNTVKGFAQQEQDVFVKVTEARAGLNGAIKGGNMGEMANANQALTGALSRLMVTVEAYPQLKSDQNFLQLQDELTGTENRIAVARKDYNEAVGTYNAYIRKFPQVLTAKVTGAKARDYFEVTNAAAKDAPTVDFGKKP
jgi:LemA protein